MDSIVLNVVSWHPLPLDQQVAGTVATTVNSARHVDDKAANRFHP